MNKRSAGIVAFRYADNRVLQVLLVHPGGPFFIRKDLGVWSIPKGEYEAHEDALAVAKREFEEETGNVVNGTTFIELTPVKIKSGKMISAWAIEANFDECFISSNTFEMEWPPKSGKKKHFTEVDMAGWFTPAEARLKLNAGQVALIDELEKKLLL